MTKRPPRRLPLHRDRLWRLDARELLAAAGGDTNHNPRNSQRGCNTLDSYIMTACPTIQTE